MLAKNRRKGEPLLIVGSNMALKPEIEVSLDPAILILVVYPKDSKLLCHTSIFIQHYLKCSVYAVSLGFYKGEDKEHLTYRHSRGSFRLNEEWIMSSTVKARQTAIITLQIKKQIRIRNIMIAYFISFVNHKLDITVINMKGELQCVQEGRRGGEWRTGKEMDTTWDQYG